MAFEMLQGPQTLPAGVCFCPQPPVTQHPTGLCSSLDGQPGCQMPPESEREREREVWRIAKMQHSSCPAALLEVMRLINSYNAAFTYKT